MYRAYAGNTSATRTSPQTMLYAGIEAGSTSSGGDLALVLQGLPELRLDRSCSFGRVGVPVDDPVPDIEESGGDFLFDFHHS